MRKTIGFKALIPNTMLVLQVNGVVLRENSEYYIVESTEYHDIYRVNKNDMIGYRFRWKPKQPIMKGNQL